MGRENDYLKEKISTFLIAIALLSIMPIVSLTWHDGNLYGRNNHAHNNSIWCKKNGGEKRVKINIGNKNYVRIDCVTERYVVKTDYAKKWSKIIGQALYYAEITGKEPAVLVLINKDEKKRDFIHLNKLRQLDLVKIFIMYY